MTLVTKNITLSQLRDAIEMAGWLVGGERGGEPTNGSRRWRTKLYELVGADYGRELVDALRTYRKLVWHIRLRAQFLSQARSFFTLTEDDQEELGILVALGAVENPYASRLAELVRFDLDERLGAVKVEEVKAQLGSMIKTILETPDTFPMIDSLLLVERFLDESLVQAVEKIARIDWLHHKGVATEEDLIEARRLYTDQVIPEVGNPIAAILVSAAVKDFQASSWDAEKAQLYYNKLYLMRH